MKHERKLIYVPTLHTSHDMGTLAGSMQEVYIKKFGEKKWEQHVEAIDGMWEGIRKKIAGLNLSFAKVKLYQDGLPVCGKEKEIVEDVAGKGSLNHKLLQWMMDQGATLMGTEDPKLLVQEYNHVKEIMGAKTHEEREKLIHAFEKKESELLEKRDQFIENRIAETLKPDETGILFMGLLHRVDELLLPDIQVTYLIYRLPFQRSFEMEMVA